MENQIKKDYKELYIQAVAKTLKPGSYNLGNDTFTCYTGPLGYALFDADVIEKVYREYGNLTDEEIQLKFKEKLEQVNDRKD